jgi:phosphatidylglycerophosphate synthase
LTLLAIPLSLTLLRLVLGPVAIWLALAGAARGIFALVLIAGLLSDYYDGALARRFGVARPWLRRLDSTVDIAFYLSIAVVAYLLEQATVMTAIGAVIALVASDLACILASLLKFRSLPGTHTYSAKAYGVALFACSLGVLCFSWGPWAIWLLGAFGLVANTESLAIILLSAEPPIDVASVFRRVRRGSRPDGPAANDDTRGTSPL